jgi:hypothetical protein
MIAVVKGCAHRDVCNHINGCYKEAGENHGIPMYKSTTAPTPAFLYYWDQRDGLQFQGWWIGPEVGSASYWAYNATVDWFPPHIGWSVGNVIEETMEISRLPTPPPPTDPIIMRIQSVRTDGTGRIRTKKKIMYDNSHPLAIKRKQDHAARNR